jgi:MarR family transcriptional regulator, organic hydroperoxide resistance regulator
LTVRELSELVSLEPATISPLLKRLEAIGYLTRRRAVDDERNLQVSLTAQGRTLRRRALGIPAAIMKRLDMDRAQLESLHATLTAVIDRTRAIDA